MQIQIPSTVILLIFFHCIYNFYIFFIFISLSLSHTHTLIFRLSLSHFLLAGFLSTFHPAKYSLIRVNGNGSYVTGNVAYIAPSSPRSPRTLPKVFIYIYIFLSSTLFLTILCSLSLSQLKLQSKATIDE